MSTPHPKQSLRFTSGPPQLLKSVGRPVRSCCEASSAPTSDRPLFSRRQPMHKLKSPAQAGLFLFSDRSRSYLILASLNSTCLRTTGSYFLKLSFSVCVREFFLVT